MQNLENYFTVRQFAEKFQFTTQSGLRYYIFHSAKNGFDKVIKRIGTKVLINSNAFEKWLEENNGRNIVKGNFR